MASLSPSLAWWLPQRNPKVLIPTDFTNCSLLLQSDCTSPGLPDLILGPSSGRLHFGQQAHDPCASPRAWHQRNLITGPGLSLAINTRGTEASL